MDEGAFGIQGSQKCLHFWEEEEQGSGDKFSRLRGNEHSGLCSDDVAGQKYLLEERPSHEVRTEEIWAKCEKPAMPHYN